jgi:hypothetical protein
LLKRNIHAFSEWNSIPLSDGVEYPTGQIIYKLIHADLNNIPVEPPLAVKVVDP